MRKFTIPGFPETGPKIDLPDIAELLFQPMWTGIGADDLMKHGTDLQRELLRRAPLKNDRRDVSVCVWVNMLYPGAFTGPAVEWKGTVRAWHRDGHPDLFDNRLDRVHLLVSDCEARTEFNEVKQVVNVPDDVTPLDVMAMVNDGPVKLVGRKAESRCFVTFDNHFHRPTEASHRQFRYLFRIVESDDYRPRRFPDCKKTDVAVVHLGGDVRLRRAPNLTQRLEDDQVHLFGPGFEAR